MEFFKNIWSTGDPITVEKMNRIENALEYAVGTSNHYVDNEATISNTLQDMATALLRIDTIDTLATGANTRSNAIEQEILALKQQLDSGVNYSSLLALAQIYKAKINNAVLTSGNNKTRLDAIDTLLDDLQNNVTSVHTAAIANLDTVTNDHTSRLEYIGTELGMYDSATETWSNDSSRLDSIEATLDVLTGSQEGEGTIGSIQEAISAINSTLNHETTGLAATKAIADGAATGANAANAKIGTGFSSENTVASAISDINTALGTKANSSDLAAKADVSALNTLDNKIDAVSTTIVVPKNKVTFNDGVPASFDSSIQITDKNDYLIQSSDDNKYYYWKPFVATANPLTYSWQMISGGGNGSGGNSSGYIYSTSDYEAIVTKNENTDYYVLDSDGYHHYRWVGDTEIEIAEPNKYYNIAIESTEGSDGPIYYLNLYGFNPGDDTVIDDNTDLSTLSGKLIRHIMLPATGGGSGIVNNMRITPITARNVYVAYGSNISTKLRFFFTTGEANEPVSYNIMVDGVTQLANPVNITSGDPANKAYTWPVDGNNEELSVEAAAALGFYEVDISDYCKTMGTHAVKIVVALDSNTAITSESNWNVQTISLGLTSNSTENPIAEVNEAFAFSYIPSGNIEKVAHFILNGTELPSVTLAARVNSTQNYTIPAQTTAGTYKLEVYLTANNGALRTSSIYRDIIWRDSSSSTVIIASPYRGNTETIQQYNTINIPYTIVGGNTSTYTVKYYVDDFVNEADEVTLTNTNIGKWSYRAEAKGSHTLRIACGETYIDINLNVTELNIDIAPVTNNLAIDFNPLGITNSSAKRLWDNDTYHMTVSDNFDWYNGGYGTDSTGSYFLIKAGTRAYFDYKMFKSYNKTVNGAITTGSTVFRDGTEMKLIFKTNAVRNADAIWFTNMGPTNETSAAKDVGIELKVHNGYLKTDSAEGNNTKSYLYFPYSEEDRIELDININPESMTNAIYCMSYEDGCPSRAYPYKTTEALYQASGEEAPITIGSDDCDVYIYRLRIYNAALDTEDVLRNFIADGKDVTTCIERYNRNSIYYDTQNEEYTPYMGPNTTLDPVRLAEKVPDVKILMLDAPTFTVDKNTFVKGSTLRCIHAPGGKVYPSRGKEDNWFFGNGYHSGQGTTSDKYGDAGRNVDFLFNCDGVHKPSNKVENVDPNYISYVIKGYGTDEQEQPKYCLDWKDSDTWAESTEYALDDLVIHESQVYKCTEAHTSTSTFDSSKWELQEGYTEKVSLTETSIQNNFFNLKVNIASSENVNNALFQKRYNDYLIGNDYFLSPAYLRDHRIKNDMEFVPAILFIRENSVAHRVVETVDNQEVVNYTDHTEFNDTEWHFYALGNIGDSKKTDYTRAYDPNDMNEFTLEISDNNTNNSQFQTGVYMKNGERTIEGYTIEQDYDEEKKKYKDTYSAVSSEEDITVLTTDYLYPIDYETEWAAVDGNGDPINMRYWGLMNEKFDGDHSFEMRYACEGNYRDGKLVNDTHGKITVNSEQISRDKYQLELNSNVWRAFYTWLVTCSDEQFVDELDLWCVRKSVAYFFAFTQYYTMIDNRAKNTFWHFAKTNVYHDVPEGRAVPELLHVYEESSDNGATWSAATGDTIDPNKKYRTQYAFDMWAYDMDTAAGIDNNGELIFPYGKEDTDYRVDGDPNSGMVFNGAGSVFWARLRANCNSDITNAFTNVDPQCFNADNLITEFDKVQNCYPEAIWRLDVERKYIRSFTGDMGIDPSNPNQTIYLTRQNTRFLGDMMQGRKKYQRRQWIKDQGVYFGSKYKLSNITGNQCDMVCYTIADQNVRANWDLTLTPYQDMYINVDYAETKMPPVRAKANVPVEIKCPFTSMNESRVRIYGSDYIRTIAGKAIRNESEEIIGANGLASFYFRGNDFSHIKKLRELYIGSSDPTYSNNQFTTLNLPQNTDIPILEVLDIQNCDGLSGALDLSRATAIKRVEAQGTALTQIMLPSSTGIQTLHLPSSINRLALTAAKNLNEITIRTKTGNTNDVSNLTELIINNSDYNNLINWMDIANSALSHLSNLQLIGLMTSYINNISELEPFVERKDELGNFTNESGNEVSRINLEGTLKVTGEWSQVEKDAYEAEWNNQLTLNTIGTELTKYAVTYRYDAYDDGTGNIIGAQDIVTIYVGSGGLAPDIYESGLLTEMPSRNRTVRNTYIFGSQDPLNNNQYIPYSGWKLEGSSTALSSAPIISGPTVIETYFNEITRTYPIKWYLNEGDPTSLISTSMAVEYGKGENLSAPTVTDIHNAGKETCTVSVSNDGSVTYSIFKGWDKLPININPSISDDSFNIYGVWETETTTVNTMFANINNLTPQQLLVLSAMNNDIKNAYNIYNRLGTNKRLTCNMGYTSVEDNSGISLLPNNEVLRLDAQTVQPITTNIQPLKAGSDAFTIVLDYCFNENMLQNCVKDYAILAGCYYGNGAQDIRRGLALYYDKTREQIRLGFGDMFSYESQSLVIGSSYNLGTRNVVVLRHAAGNELLHVYSGLGGSTNIPTTVYHDTISLLNNNTDAYFTLGKLLSSQDVYDPNDDIPNHVENGKGTIYYARYWNKDLGAGECAQLAAWPHEQMTFAISYLGTDRTHTYNSTLNRVVMTASNDYPIPSIKLASLTASQHGKYTQGQKRYAEANNYTYGVSDLYNICNTRIYNGLPTILQAILCKVRTVSTKALYSSNNQGGTYEKSTSNNVTSDYVALYSAANVMPDGSNYEAEDSINSPFGWYEAANVTAYQFISGGWNVNSADTERAEYLNIRCPGKAIKVNFTTTDKLRVFREVSSTIPSNTSIVSTIRSSTGEVHDGDIYLDSTGSAFIYAPIAEISALGIQYEPYTTSTDKFYPDTTVPGAWVRAESYWTRSLIITNNGVNFAYVQQNGKVEDARINSVSSAGIKFNYLLAI